MGSSESGMVFFLILLIKTIKVKVKGYMGLKYNSYKS